MTIYLAVYCGHAFRGDRLVFPRRKWRSLPFLKLRFKKERFTHTLQCYEHYFLPCNPGNHEAFGDPRLAFVPQQKDPRYIIVWPSVQPLQLMILDQLHSVSPGLMVSEFLKPQLKVLETVLEQDSQKSFQINCGIGNTQEQSQESCHKNLLTSGYQKKKMLDSMSKHLDQIDRGDAPGSSISHNSQGIHAGGEKKKPLKLIISKHFFCRGSSNISFALQEQIKNPCHLYVFLR